MTGMYYDIQHLSNKKIFFHQFIYSFVFVDHWPSDWGRHASNALHPRAENVSRPPHPTPRSARGSIRRVGHHVGQQHLRPRFQWRDKAPRLGCVLREFSHAGTVSALAKSNLKHHKKNLTRSLYQHEKFNQRHFSPFFVQETADYFDVNVSCARSDIRLNITTTFSCGDYEPNSNAANDVVPSYLVPPGNVM